MCPLLGEGLSLLQQPFQRTKEFEMTALFPVEETEAQRERSVPK
jgi:hypothetical protein